MKLKIGIAAAGLLACYTAAVLPLPNVVYAVLGAALVGGVAAWGIENGF